MSFEAAAFRIWLSEIEIAKPKHATLEEWRAYLFCRIQTLIEMREENWHLQSVIKVIKDEYDGFYA